jgi:phosphoribosyl-AMP cyclohydrolase
MTCREDERSYRIYHYKISLPPQRDRNDSLNEIPNHERHNMNDNQRLTINEELIGQIKFDEKGLVPAIAQDEKTGEILMVAYMNRESLQNTFETGHATFWSRSRQKIWMKGETSGNILKVSQILIDCDCDTLVLKVHPAGPACHTGERTCFYRILAE